jgi:hypothetical protein
VSKNKGCRSLAKYSLERGFGFTERLGNVRSDGAITCLVSWGCCFPSFCLSCGAQTANTIPTVSGAAAKPVVAQQASTQSTVDSSRSAVPGIPLG